jgi:hypothetical protein
MNKVYVVTMYKCGDRNNHSYLLGVFTKKNHALEMADEHEEYRGNKYDAEIIEVTVDVSYDTYSTPEDYKFIRNLAKPGVLL